MTGNGYDPVGNAGNSTKFPTKFPTKLSKGQFANASVSCVRK